MEQDGETQSDDECDEKGAQVGAKQLGHPAVGLMPCYNLNGWLADFVWC